MNKLNQFGVWLYLSKFLLMNSLDWNCVFDKAPPPLTIKTFVTADAQTSAIISSMLSLVNRCQTSAYGRYHGVKCRAASFTSNTSNTRKPHQFCWVFYFLWEKQMFPVCFSLGSWRGNAALGPLGLVPADSSKQRLAQLSASGFPESSFPFTAGGDVTGIVSTSSWCCLPFNNLLIRCRWEARGAV